jgi:hypothetical protein
MQRIDLSADYIGADVIVGLMARLQAKHGRPGRRFVCLDLVQDRLPRADLLFCRDALVHFSYLDIFDALRNIARSGPSYVLLTTFPGRSENADIATGQGPLNLELSFHFPPVEAERGVYAMGVGDKSMVRASAAM